MSFDNGPSPEFVDKTQSFGNYGDLVLIVLIMLLNTSEYRDIRVEVSENLLSILAHK